MKICVCARASGTADGSFSLLQSAALPRHKSQQQKQQWHVSEKKKSRQRPFDPFVFISNKPSLAVCRCCACDSLILQNPSGRIRRKSLNSRYWEVILQGYEHVPTQQWSSYALRQTATAFGCMAQNVVTRTCPHACGNKKTAKTWSGSPVLHANSPQQVRVQLELWVLTGHFKQGKQNNLSQSFKTMISSFKSVTGLWAY